MWAEQQGITIVPQLAFNHTAAASAEKFWQFYEAQVRANAHLFPGNETVDAMTAFAWNTQTKESQFTPFEIQFGGPAVAAAVHFPWGDSSTDWKGTASIGCEYTKISGGY